MPKTAIFNNTVILFFVSVFLFGCLEYKEVQVKKVQRVGIKTFSITEVSFFVDMQIENPNNYKISITDADLDLYIKDQKFGKAVLQNNVVLPKKSNEVHQIIISSPLKDAVSGAIPLVIGMLGKRSVPIQVKGEIKGKVKGIGKKIPVDFKENVVL